MSKELNFKPYIIGVLIVSVLVCIFSYKAAAGLVLGTAYFFISDALNQKKFNDLSGKGKTVSKVFLIGFIQFILILAIAAICFYFGGLSSFILSFVGITIPHIYFIIAELRKK